MKVIKMMAVKPMKQNGETESKKYQATQLAVQNVSAGRKGGRNTPGTSSGYVRIELWVMFFFSFQRYLDMEV